MLSDKLINHGGISDIDFAKKVYANLCNLAWYDLENEEIISFSWRSSGAFVASLRRQLIGTNEDYMDFYCSGEEGELDSNIESLFNSWNIVNIPDYYNFKPGEMTEESKIEHFKKNHPIIVSWERDKKINKIL